MRSNGRRELEDPEGSILGLIWLEARIIWTQRLEMSTSSVEQERQPVRTSLDCGVTVLQARGYLGLQSHHQQLRAEKSISLLPCHTLTTYSGLQNCEKKNPPFSMVQVA